MLSKLNLSALPRSALSVMTLFLSMASLPVYAASFPGCFSSAPDYNATYTRELTASENVVGGTPVAPGHLIGSGPELEANCQCPTMSSGTEVFLITFAGSPLNPGVSGYGYLTSKVDVAVSGYGEAITSPSGSGLERLPVREYPTPLSAMESTTEAKSTEKKASVCSADTRPSGGTTTKRKFKWNVIGATFYIKTPILGEEIIPSTLVIQNYACLSSGAYCDPADPNIQQVSNIWLSGSLTAPLSCTINAGGTIEVEFGSIVNKQFVAKGQPPQGYALKNVDISYHCDGAAVSNADRIKLTLTADQGTAEGSDRLIAKMLGRDDIGVRVFDSNQANVALDGTFAFPVTLDEEGNGVIRLQAAPVSTQNSTPEPGKFEGNVTVKMDLR